MASFAMDIRRCVLLLLLAAPPVRFAAAAIDVIAEARRIDDILAKSWSAQKIEPGPPVSDEVFLRRIYLDAAGRIPTVDEARQFLSSVHPAKRARLIDQLVANDGHASHMFNFFADLLRLADTGGKSKVVAQAYAEWLKEQLRTDRPYDEMVREMLGNSGMAYDTGAVGYYARDENQLDNVAFTAQVFLGTQIVCAQCHDHPFDKWKMTDYYGFAAFSHGLNPNGASLDLLKLDSGARAAKLKIGDLASARDALSGVLQPLKYAGTKFDPRRQLALPHDYKYTDHKPGDVIAPQPLFAPDATVAPDESRLRTVARWITSPDNPRFTLVIANRLWKHAFGLGVIEPVDEMTDSTTAPNPELMERLTRLMKDARYSMRDFQRVIFNTGAYQRAASTTRPLPGEPYHFPGPLLRRQSAEQIWDSVVTLLHGSMDEHVSEQNQELRQYLAGIKRVADTVKQRGLAGLSDVAQEAAKRNEASKAKVDAMRAEVNAKSGASMDDVRAIGRYKSELAQKDRDATLAAILGIDNLESLLLDYKPGSAKNRMRKKGEKPARDADDRDSYLQQRGAKLFYDRAAEQPSPARPGHFLRTFGQSDRDTIDNGNREITLPQTLALLNGPVSETLGSHESALQNAVDAADGTLAKLDTLYLGLLARRPTDEEHQVLRDLVSERGDRAVADLRHALLLGAEFLFVR